VRTIINNGNTYTEKMVSNYNNGIIAGAVMGLFGILGFLLSISSYNKSKSWVKGAKGEKLVSKYLNQLSKDYIILNNVTLPGRYGNIDHIVVGTTEFLLSKLNFRGSYTIDWNQWLYGSGSNTKEAYSNPGE